MKKYILHPGMITSETDGDEHYINALQLSELYGVNIRDCYVDRPDCGDLLGVDRKNLIELFPQYHYEDYQKVKVSLTLSP